MKLFSNIKLSNLENGDMAQTSHDDLIHHVESVLADLTQRRIVGRVLQTQILDVSFMFDDL